MKKILVIGVKGMAGHMLYNYFDESKLYDVYGLARNIEASPQLFNIDVSDTAQLRSLFIENQFDYVVNCIGILNKDAEDYPSKAIWFNSYFPHYLEEITKETQTKVIHISTDCVFSGKEGGYTENDIKNGIGFYAKSKALGELTNTKDVTIRTSIIGPELNQNGIGLFHWFMSQSDEVRLNGFTNAFWSGLTTLELAKVVLEIIRQNVSGLIQVAPSAKIDKYNLISLFNSIYRNGKMTIEPNGNYHVDKSLVSIRTDFEYQVPNYQEMLESQRDWILKHSGVYSHYL
ncbi:MULTISPECIES: dTDP-4-dehydrorhamnose reductase family protein [unclassified Flavobacterium]|jgi:dTDP-4-dehydrorhamnose reductase|uniref:dTDP-4-dehydrorhamnose reductase family protein n=1 Tax=unclassified Flavobacterium TaxID=196869 RepID=UPI0025C66057|nr:MULTISPECIES: SDR family oxidoreductase [unclassified Flavobacterium]